MALKNLVFVLTCLSYSVIIGAAIYEHIAVWPNAFADLPQSLSSFQGKYKINSAPFWMSIHPVTLFFFFLTAFISWKTERKKFVIIPLLIYVLILATTFIYFVPELMSLISTKFSETSDKLLTSRAKKWEMLSLVRLVCLVASSMVLYMGLTRNCVKNRV